MVDDKREVYFQISSWKGYEKIDWDVLDGILTSKGFGEKKTALGAASLISH